MLFEIAVPYLHGGNLPNKTNKAGTESIRQFNNEREIIMMKDIEAFNCELDALDVKGVFLAMQRSKKVPRSKNALLNKPPALGGAL